MDTIAPYLPWMFGLFGLVVVGNVLLQLSDRVTLLRAIRHLLNELPKSIDALGKQWDRDREANEERVKKMWERNVALAELVAERDRERVNTILAMERKPARMKAPRNGVMPPRFIPTAHPESLNEADSLLAGKHME